MVEPFAEHPSDPLINTCKSNKELQKVIYKTIIRVSGWTYTGPQVANSLQGQTDDGVIWAFVVGPRAFNLGKVEGSQVERFI